MIVIPMAGLSSRFSRAGYASPKWMLPLADRPLFDWSLLGFDRYFDTDEFVIIHLDLPGTGEFVAQRCRKLGIRSPRLVALTAPTRGQADTVRLGLEAARAGGDAPVTIFNIDTMRPKIELPTLEPGVSGSLETFVGDGDHWSFVRPDPRKAGLAAEVVEKKRISPYCCTGLYHFARADIFMEALAAEAATPTMSELYVAPLYQRLIQAGAKVAYSEIGLAEVFFSGTPEEYEQVRTREAEIIARFRSPS